MMKKLIFLTSFILLIHSTFAGRFYNPEFGRWLNRDPIGVNGGINIYNSVSNNVVNGYSGGLDHSGGMEQNTGELKNSKRVDSWGNYQEDGHFWTTYIMSYITTKELRPSFELAYYSQLPDIIKNYDAIGSLGRIDGIDSEDVQNYLHSLHGGDVNKRRNLLRKLIKNEKVTWKKGFMIHAFGDTYAHVKIKLGLEEAYDFPLGHFEDGTSPDIIALRPKQYGLYINDLSTVLGTPKDSSKELILFANRLKPHENTFLQSLNPLEWFIDLNEQTAAKTKEEFRKLTEAKYFGPNMWTSKDGWGNRIPPTWRNWDTRSVLKNFKTPTLKEVADFICYLKSQDK